MTHRIGKQKTRGFPDDEGMIEENQKDICIEQFKKRKKEEKSS